MASSVLEPSPPLGEPLIGISLSAIGHTYSITASPILKTAAATSPKTLTVNQGIVTLDGAPIHRPRLGDYVLSWGQTATPGQSHARLQISKDRLSFEGLIGTAAPGAAPELYKVKGVAAPQSSPSSSTGNLSHLAAQPATAAPTSTPEVAISPRGQVGGSPTLDLPRLITQNTEGIGDQTQTLLMANLAWALEPKWAAAFFDSVPNLSQDAIRMNIIDQDCEWYNCSFAPAYFGYGLSQSTRKDAKYTLSQQDVNRLQYYLCEDIGEDVAYARQTKALTVLAALAATSSNNPNLADYANDTSNPPGYWANQLYTNYLNTPTHYEQLASGVPDENGNSQPQSLQNAMQTLNNYATILTVLDPTGQTAQNYYQSAYAAILAAFLPNVELPSDVNTYEEWLGDWIQALINDYMASPTQPADPAAAAAWSAGQTFSQVVALGESVDQVATSIAQLFVASNTGLISTTAANAANQVAASYPKLTGAAKYFMIIAVCALWMQNLEGTANLSSLDPPDLVTAVNNLVGLTAGLISIVPDLINVAKWVGTNTQVLATAIRSVFFSPSGIQNIIALQGRVGNPVQIFGWMRSSLQNGAFNPGTSRFSTAFKFAGKALSVLGVLVAVVAAGVSIWTLVLDVQSGGSTATIVFDIANAALSFAAAAAAFAAVACESVIPAVIGAIAALGGVIVWFVASFFQDDPPPSPPDQYLQNVAAPLAAGLSDPPDDWKPPSVMGSSNASAAARVRASWSALALNTATPVPSPA